MTRMRKWTAVLLAVLLLAALTACTAEEFVSAMETAAETINDLAEEQRDELAEAITEQQAEEPVPPAETSAPEAEQPAGTEAPAEEPKPAETPAPEAEPPAEDETPAEEPAPDEAQALDPDGEYTSKEDVALYLHLYGELPRNFITKKEAQALGWSGGGLDGYADGKSIGGDRFGNYEGLLPEAEGREYHECDIDTMHASSRGAKRIVYSNDGLIYYTDDHYESYTLLYPEE